MVSQAKRELANSYIGHYVGRLKNGVPTTELHRAESAINDLVVMHCGKQMRAEAYKHADVANGTPGGSGMAIAEYFPDNTGLCQVCTGVEGLTAADIALGNAPSAVEPPTTGVVVGAQP